MSAVGTASYVEGSVARPLREPAGRPAPEPRRHLEVAPSRSQRRARPRLIHGLLIIGGIGAILLIQLMLSIALADGAYTISNLQTSQRDLLREQQALTETLELRSSTQNLTANAEALGMVASGNPYFLNVATGEVSGAGTAAGGSLVGGQNLIDNSLLDGSTVLDPVALAAALAAENASGDTGAATVSGATPGTTVTPATPGTIPSPQTH